MNAHLRISLAALRNNAELLRRLAAPVKAAFVVKANAYGHGLEATALAIEPLADLLCVYTLGEALALRAAGVVAPVLVLGPLPADGLDAALAARVEVALWDREFAARLAAAARLRETSARVHLKVNTDLNRLGLEPSGLSDAVARLGAEEGLELAGIFSHLAAAEELDSPYTMRQLATFERALGDVMPRLQAAGAAPVRHIAASAAAMLWPQTRLDMVRFGIALYGLMPSPQTREAMGAGAPDLQPALSFHSKLIVVREVPAGASVGYGGTFHAPHDMRIGVVPAGYADGVPRALSNRGAFVVDGALCPIVGRVAMNMTQIDLSRAPNAAVGTPVTLIGREGDACVSASDWAKWADTIDYEIVARLPSSLSRVYD